MIFLDAAKKMADVVVVVNDRFVEYLGRLGFAKGRLVVVMNSPPLASVKRPGLRVRASRSCTTDGWGRAGVSCWSKRCRGWTESPSAWQEEGSSSRSCGVQRPGTPRSGSLGWLKMADLEPVIAKADLIPSLYEPRTRNAMIATPGKLLTAMSLSVPSLVPSGTYQAELVKKYRCGFVVDWKDVDDVRRAIVKLASDPRLYDELSTASYEALSRSSVGRSSSRDLRARMKDYSPLPEETWALQTVERGRRPPEGYITARGKIRRRTDD